jgi:hypothetical protein
LNALKVAKEEGQLVTEGFLALSAKQLVNDAVEKVAGITADTQKSNHRSRLFESNFAIDARFESMLLGEPSKIFSTASTQGRPVASPRRTLSFWDNRTGRARETAQLIHAGAKLRHLFRV